MLEPIKPLLDLQEITHVLIPEAQGLEMGTTIVVLQEPIDLLTRERIILQEIRVLTITL